MINRLNTGIPGLDKLLGGGIPANHIITILGEFGTGKTTFALQYIYAGLQQGESCIYISLDEDEKSIIENARMFGWDLVPYIEQKKLALLHLSASDVKTSVTQIESELPRKLKVFGATRLIVDSMTLFELLFDDVSERRKHLFGLSKLIKEAGITAIFTSEVNPNNQFHSTFGLIEYIADGVISLRYDRPKDLKHVALLIEIIKIRRTHHSRSIKPYAITDKGIAVFTESEVF